MDIELFSLCDAATDYGGKLNLLGAFDTIRAMQFPSVHPHCAIALRVRFERIEEGTHRVRIGIMDEDGKPVVPTIEGSVGVSFPPTLLTVAANLVLNLNGLKVEKPGRYSIDLALDGRHEKSLPLTVLLVEAKRSPGPGGGAAPGGLQP